jgi:hypothetical protein
MEATAREAYESLTGVTVTQVGLVLKPFQAWLGGSPDGLVLDQNGNIIVLEIKCPKSCEDKPIDMGYLVNGDLKKSHQYYTQVQLLMYVCDAQLAHFFVFSSVDYKLVMVPRDSDFL